MKSFKFIVEQNTEPQILKYKDLSKLLKGFSSEPGQSPLMGEMFEVFGPITSNTKTSAKFHLNSLNKSLDPRNKVYFFYKEENGKVVGYKIIEYKSMNEGREPIAQGLEHRIFPSKNNPKVLFKVGENEIIDEWVNTFKNDSSVFPKIFHVGLLPDKKHKFVALEKLDTSAFEKKWDDLELALEDIGAVDVDRRESFTDLYAQEGTDSKVFGDIAIELRNHDKEIFDFYIDLLRVIKRAEKVQNETLKKDTLVDAHKYNFGYNEDGNLKMLDV